MAAATPLSPPNRTRSTDTTLSFAMKPFSRDVTILQSPRPMGMKTGVIRLARAARMLSRESVTILKRKSKLFRNHTTIVAIRITEKARCRKSLLFSQRSCATFLTRGSR